MHTPAATTFKPIAARPAPHQSDGLLAVLRKNLFGSASTSIATLLTALVFFPMLAKLLNWALWDAVWRPDFSACHVAHGACWGVIAEKYRFILFGRYPFDQQWRPLVCTLLLLGSLVISGMRACWKPWLGALWVVVITVFFVVMHGGYGEIGGGEGSIWSLSRVDTDRWGGLPLTILLSALSMSMAFPIAVLIALGRRSSLPAIRSICTIYIELVRGVPLISVLFMASFMFPLLMPHGFNIDVLVRVIAGITLFAAAYMAEVIRGGLQAIPKGQEEAAATLGLSFWQTQRAIILPQALALVVPGIVNNFIATFKDTSLVTIVSLYELTGAMGMALNSDSDWRPFKLEGYLFIALIYFVFCFSMSRYSAWIETQVNRSKLH